MEETNINLQLDFESDNSTNSKKRKREELLTLESHKNLYLEAEMEETEFKKQAIIHFSEAAIGNSAISDWTKLVMVKGLKILIMESVANSGTQD